MSSGISSGAALPQRTYRYVGPDSIRKIAESQPAGIRILDVADLAAWLSSAPTERLNGGLWIATFTIGTDHDLRLAPRRSEHVACAAGAPVYAAGEITIDDELRVIEISNQSTGYCPEPESWSSVELVLDRIGLRHPGRYTNPIIFRRCPTCSQRNIVKDGWYYCDLCESKLPQNWNF